VQRTSASLSVLWRTGQGVCDSFILSMRNSTFILQTNQSASDDRCGFRSVICSEDSFFMWERLQLALFFRTFRFDNLLPGSVYTVEVSSVSGDRRSLPASAIANTRECYYTYTLVQNLARTYRLLFHTSPQISSVPKCSALLYCLHRQLLSKVACWNGTSWLIRKHFT